MEYELYQRPREKLRIKGAEALSIAELLQIILGSGSSKISGAKIARLIEKLFVENRVNYETLICTEGVGEAKACQILATIELSRRVGPGG
jgi:DNA repair protein RadC